MDLKKMLLPIALLSSLAPLASFADPDRPFGYDRSSGYGGYERSPHDGWREDSWRNREDRGHYQLRTVQQWVPGRYEQTWVPQQCWTRPRWGGEAIKCRGGFYASRWIPGHYEAVQSTVWVPFHGYPPSQPYGGWGYPGALPPSNG